MNWYVAWAAGVPVKLFNLIIGPTTHGDIETLHRAAVVPVCPAHAYANAYHYDAVNAKH